MRHGKTGDDCTDQQFEWDMTAVVLLLLLIVFVVVAAMSALPFGHAS